MPNQATSPSNQRSMAVQLIERRIFLVRGRKVMLSPDLAELYQVEARVLVQAVKRNSNRFPADFMFQLTREEYANLKSQFVISRWGGARRAAPYAFTEHGVAMLSAVLRSRRAVQMSIVIVRAFVHIRELLASHRNLATRVEKLEGEQKTHASIISILADEIVKLKKPAKLPAVSKRQFGFRSE
jgi:hypothetical protein